MSRTHRASTAAIFAYLQFGLAIVVGIVLVPFVLDRIGIRLYGYWLASGEVLAYAAMADLGILGVVPWMIAEADGRGDRDAIRRLLSTGFWAAVVVSLIYFGLVLLIWQVAPALLKLTGPERAAIAGPLALMAAVTAIVLPLRIAGSALMGLQDVKVYGVLTTCSWALDVILTIVLLRAGFGLYALACAASLPSSIVVIASIVRLRMIAPDLLTQWPRPSFGALVRLFREGIGSWLGAWGWRLTAATDAIVVASLGNPAWITMLAMTAKLGQMLTHMAWVPGDSGLVGLANLAGEGDRNRLRAAVSALFRVYLTMAGAAACAVLVANGAFVSAWVGPGLFAGSVVNGALAVLMIAATMAHAAAVIGSVLGRRMQVGLATLASGALQALLALVLGRQLGLVGIPLAALMTQTLVLIPVLMRAMPALTGLTARDAVQHVLWPWSVRIVPLVIVCAAAGPFLRGVPMIGAVAAGGLLACAGLWSGRHLILDYPPVAAVIRQRLAIFGLGGLVPVPSVERERVP